MNAYKIDFKNHPLFSINFKKLVMTHAPQCLHRNYVKKFTIINNKRSIILKLGSIITMTFHLVVDS
jgi:hypothetical protein